jgi:hypothetical protein
MLRLNLKIEARLMWPYVTPQPRKIRHTAPAIYLKYPSLLRAYLSTTQSRKKEQAVSAISSTTLTYENASVETLFSNIDILGLQSQENARGKSRAAGTTLALFRVAQPFTAGEQRLEANSQEQEGASKIANTRLPPMSKTCSKELYWQKIPLWQDISEERFQEYKWQVSCYEFVESHSVPQGTC